MMKEKTTIPKRVKGTVLLTVVAVMMVLIVFLAATLALATTANRRAYTNYQQEQMEYTARGILDSVMEQVRTDASVDGSGICSYIVGTSVGSPQDFDVTISDGTNSEVHNVVVTNMDDTRSIYDDTTASFVPLNIYQLSVTVASETTNASATYDSYIGLNREWITNPSSPPTPTPTSNNGGAFVSLGDTAGTEIAVHGYTTGGTYLGIGIMPTNYKLGSNEMTIDAPFYVNGSLEVPNKLYMHFTKPNDSMVVKGDLAVTVNDMFTSFAGYSDTGADYDNTPYIFVEGKFSANNNIQLGEDDHPLNFYLGSIDMSSNGKKKLYGDIYLMDAGKESVFGNNNNESGLYRWTSGTFSRSDAKGTFNTSYGNIFSMGSVKFNVTGSDSYRVQGNVQVKENLTLTGGNNWYITIDGDIYVDGTLTIPPNTRLVCNGNIYVGELNNQGTIECAGTINAANKVSEGTLNKPCAEITGLAPVANTTTTLKYYTNVDNTGAPEWWIYSNATPEFAWYAPNHYKLAVAYNEHVIDPVTGAESVTQHGDSGSGVWWGREDIVEFDVDPAAYATPEDYLMATNELFANLNSGATSPATAISVTNTTYSYDLDDAIGREVYPSAYTKAELLTNKIDDPTAIDYESMYPTDPTDLDPAIFDGGQYQITIFGGSGTEYSSVQAAGNKDANISAGGLLDGGHYTINTDCVLTGSWDKNIYINGSAGARTVVLDNFSLSIDKSIIIDDTNLVTLVVVGDVNLSQRCYIITTDYLKQFNGGTLPSFDDNLAAHVNGGTATIPQVAANTTDDTYPNVIIYSVDPTTTTLIQTASGSSYEMVSKLEFDMNCFVTALVRAPKMVYKSSGGNEAIGELVYVLPTGETVSYGANASIDPGNNKTIGLIGQLIAGSIQFAGTSSWGMLYVTDGGGTGTPPTPPATPPGGTPSSGYWVTTFRTLYTNTY